MIVVFFALNEAYTFVLCFILLFDFFRGLMAEIDELEILVAEGDESKLMVKIDRLKTLVAEGDKERY